MGFALGFASAIPVAGPASAIVLSRGLLGRPREAALVGCGCAFAEGVYAGLAYWGFSAASARYPALVAISHVVSALILLLLGLAFVRQRAPAPAAATSSDHDAATLAQSFVVGFSVTIVNPAILATWSASTAMLRSVGLTVAPAGALPFGLGVALGMAAWFGGFAWFLARAGGRFRPAVFAGLVRAVGVLLLGLAVLFAWRAARAWL